MNEPISAYINRFFRLFHSSVIGMANKYGIYWVLYVYSILKNLLLLCCYHNALNRYFLIYFLFFFYFPLFITFFFFLTQDPIKSIFHIQGFCRRFPKRNGLFKTAFFYLGKMKMLKIFHYFFFHRNTKLFAVLCLWFLHVYSILRSCMLRIYK